MLEGVRSNDLRDATCGKNVSTVCIVRVDCMCVLCVLIVCVYCVC